LPQFVQFMHPGLEAIPNRETTVSWNRGNHRRKFLKCSGIRLDENLRQPPGDIIFWGEWEPESEVIRRLENPLKEGPHYIYRPYYVIPKSYKGLQNTDPFVFGNAFRYSLCQQPSHPCLRNLEKGSVILFGSCIGGKFALDTVFVVSGDGVNYSPQNCDVLLQQVDETYRIVTMNPIRQMENANNKACAGKTIPGKLTSYCGATFEKQEQVYGMFSFFPCQAYTDDSLGFARPIIQMPVISDKMTRGIKNTPCENQNDIRNYWEEVVEQVRENCSPGIFAETPRESKVNPE